MERGGWRYQRGNQNQYIEEKQTTQWPKEKVQTNKQRSTKHTYKITDRSAWTPLKTGDELRCSGRVCSSCSTSGTRRVNLDAYSVKSREWGKDRAVFTTSGTYPWSFVTQRFCVSFCIPRKIPFCSFLIFTFTWLPFLFQLLITMKPVSVLISCVLLISLLNVQPSHSMSCSYCLQQATTCNNNCYQMLSNIIGNIGRKRRSFSCYDVCTKMHEACSKGCT